MPYDGVVAFLRDFLDTDHGLSRIGITAYPDGHALIDQAVVHDALHAKQALLAEAGIPGYASTQMCFDIDKWTSWATAERAAGFTLPLHLGVPGVIDRTKLLTMGMRLGIGSSMRYVKKNKGVLGRLFSPGGYDPTKLIVPLSKLATELNIEACTCSRSTTSRRPPSGNAASGQLQPSRVRKLNSMTPQLGAVDFGRGWHRPGRSSVRTAGHRVRSHRPMRRVSADHVSGRRLRRRRPMAAMVAGT